MKTIPLPNTGQKCYRCGEMIFEFSTPGGADYTSCPICGGGCTCCLEKDWDPENKLSEEEYDRIFGLDFCGQCKIVYDVGCMHAENGCTDNTYWGALVIRYQYLGQTFEGQPQFESFEECRELLPNLELEFQCMCVTKGGCETCPKASYPKEKYPQYYRSECCCENN